MLFDDNCDGNYLWIFCLQLQGSFIVGSLFQMFVGFSGLIGLFLRFIGPLTIAPTISLIGLSLFDSAGTSAGYHWGVAVMWVPFLKRLCGVCWPSCGWLVGWFYRWHSGTVYLQSMCRGGPVITPALFLLCRIGILKSEFTVFFPLSHVH